MIWTSEGPLGEAVFGQDELATLARDGVLIKRTLFDSEEIGLLEAACANDQTMARNTILMKDTENRKFVQTVWNHPGDDLYGMFARCERMVGGIEQLLGGEVYHYHSKVTWKHPGDGAIAWHQDYGYWYENGCLFPDLASCLIAIHKADRANACLEVLKGSHRMGRLDHVQVAGQSTVDPARMAEALKVLDVLYCELEPGDAVFAHCNTIHRSAANQSDRSRQAMICCYNAAANNPYKESHHPRYTPLETVPDSAIKAAGHRLSRPDKVFLASERVEDPHATFESPG